MTAPANSGQGQELAASSPQQGQVSAVQQGQTDPPGGGTGGQEPPVLNAGAAPDLSAITDPGLRAFVEAQVRDAAETRREAARYRTERNALQEQVAATQRAGETAEQAAARQAEEDRAERDTLRDENRTLKTGAAIAQALTDARPINPVTVSALLQSQLTYAADGTPSNLDAALASLRQSDPYLFRRTNAGGGAATAAEGDPAPSQGVNEFIRAGRRSAPIR